MGFKFCPMCGEKLTNELFKFCPECGYNLSSEEKTEEELVESEKIIQIDNPEQLKEEKSEEDEEEERRRKEEIYYAEKRIETIDEELPNAKKYNGEQYVSSLYDSKIKLLEKIIENGKDDESILNELNKTIKEKEAFLGRKEIINAIKTTHGILSNKT